MTFYTSRFPPHPHSLFTNSATQISDKTEIKGTGVQEMSTRKRTQHTLEDTAAGSALWKVIHAVLNASPEGRLATKEVEGAIRYYYPNRRLTKSNISHSLSRSGDFELMGSAGKRSRQWILTGKSDGLKRRGVISVRHAPTKFDRRNTHFTLEYVASQPGSVAIWKLCHAVLNASPDGYFSTNEMKEALDLHYPDRMIKNSTLRYNLSQSEDFKQMYIRGKTSRRWLLTGNVKGVNRIDAVRAIESCGATGILSAGDDDNSDEDDGNEDDEDDKKAVASRRDSPPAAGLPYPSEAEEIEAQSSPDHTFSSPTLPSSRPTSPTIALGPLPLSGRAVNSLQYTSRFPERHQPYPAHEIVGRSQYIHFENQPDAVPAQEMASSAYHTKYTDQEISGTLDALESPWPFPPPYSPSKDHLFPNTSFAPTLAPGNPGLWEPNSVQSYLPNSLSYENLRSNIPNYTGELLRTTSPTSFLQDGSVWGGASGEFLVAGNTKNKTTQPVYYPTVTNQQGAPNAYGKMTYPSYSETNTSRSESYDRNAVFGAGIALENTQPGLEVTAAGSPFGETSSYRHF